MAVPKKKSSISRRGMRKSNYKKESFQFKLCSTCKSPKLRHTACKLCSK